MLIQKATSNLHTIIFQVKQMEQKDRRTRLTSELLNGIKVIKLYAWEDHFQSNVKQIRNNEMAVLKRIAYLNSGLSFLWSTCTPFMVRKMKDTFT